MRGCVLAKTAIKCSKRRGLQRRCGPRCEPPPRCPQKPRRTMMDSPDITAPRPSTVLDATAELPALDPAAYEAEVASRQVADSSACGATPAEREVAAAEESDDHGADAAPRVFDADFMVEVERWIAQKSDELRAQQAALRDARRGLTAGVASADALSRELGANNADLEALNKRARILEDELTGERQAAQRRAAELDG